MNNVSVIGAGAWGTALAIQAHRAGATVTLWARTPFAGRASPHLAAHPLPGAITVTSELPGAADATILAVPLQHMRAVAGRLDAGGPVLVCAKGVEAGRLRLPLEVLAEALPGARSAVLTGPNFAHEVAAGLPAASVVAGTDPALRAAFIAMLGSPSFRLYGNDDPVGAQIGGAAKNVIAIAAGVVMGAGLGENARAALITRGLAELGRLTVALGGRAETVAGLSGLGDLMLTCTGASSRNFRCGLALGRGETLAEAIAQAGGVVEGVATAPALVARAAGVDLPVCTGVAALLAGQTGLRDLIAGLMSRPTRDE
jgi:glycerol-3-phosphate dehydrogenase (NAD(P)+)